MGDLVQFPTPRPKQYNTLGQMVRVLFDADPNEQIQQSHILGIMQGYAMCVCNFKLLEGFQVADSDQLIPLLLNVWITNPHVLELNPNAGILETMMIIQKNLVADKTDD